MAGKQQKQSPVRSGDVLLLYEDGRGFVYSEITPILPDCACVCFYPVKLPYSKEDPGLPDVNCGTFTIQLVSEKKTYSAVPIHYGQHIKLRHTATGRFLAVNNTTTARCEPNLRVELSDSKETTKASCHFMIVPLHRDHHALGSQVRFNQPVKFGSVEVPDHYLHSSAEPYGSNFWFQPDRHELNLSSSATSLVMILHHECETESYGCRAGSLLQLSETKECLSIIAKRFRFRNPQDHKEKPQLMIPEELNDVCAQDKYTGPDETWYSSSLWQFEEQKNPTSGELIKFNNLYRIKHVLNQKYLALVTKCGHDLNTCPEVLCREAFKVILKDRVVIQQSENEEDDTVFVPISPDEQTSTQVLLEGAQLLLHHKKSGMWLNVYHGVVFEWHDIGKSNKWRTYDTAPYYEVDANKQLVGASKDPFHAFTMSQSFQISEELYDVAGVLPVLIAIVKELLKSTPARVDTAVARPLHVEDPVTAVLKPLEDLAKQPKYHSLIAHYGLIELLLTFEGVGQLLLTLNVLKEFADKASLYEKNRFLIHVATIEPVYTSIQRSVPGMEVNLALLVNNRCQWIFKNQSEFFIHSIKGYKPSELESLCRLCLCSGKPLTTFQNVVVSEVLKKEKKIFYEVTPNDNGIFVTKDDKKKMISQLSDEEKYFLRMQFKLFARLCEGGNTKATNAILDEDDGFMTLDGALVLAMDENISADIQTEVIYLLQVLIGDSKEVEFSHTLEPPTWCFVQDDPGNSLAAVASGMKYEKLIKTLFGSSQTNTRLLLQAVKLVHMLLKKGHYRSLEVVQELFTNVLGVLKTTSSVTGHVNCEVIFQLIPLFYHLQLRNRVQTEAAHLELQTTALNEIKGLVGKCVPHDLLVCYFYWINLHHDLLQSSEHTTHEVLSLDKSKGVLQMAIQQYPKLRHHLRSLATPEQSEHIQALLSELGEKCIFEGIAHQINQSIFASIALDDILNCIFDHSASFPMWYWCNICRHAKDQSINTYKTVSECFKFLCALAYSNFKVQKRLVQHLDDFLPYCEVFPQNVAELLVEVFAGELSRGSLEDTEKSVLSHVENVHLQINEQQVKFLLQVATRRGKNKNDGKHILLKPLLFIIRYDEADLPITRNQEFVMRNLKLDDEHLALLTNTANDLEKKLGLFDENTQDFHYVLTMVDMLATCAEGRSLSIDAKCQRVYTIEKLLGSKGMGELKRGILLNPKICPARKTVFLKFLVSVYMDCEGPVWVHAGGPLVWEYLTTVDEFLKNFKMDLRSQLARAEGSMDVKRLCVQQSLMVGLRPFGVPSCTNTNTIDNVIERNDMKDIIGSVYYFLKGLLPMLIEFYGRWSKEDRPLQKEHLQISESVGQSLLELREELFKVIVSPIHLRMYRVAIGSVMNCIHKSGTAPCIPKQEVPCIPKQELSVARKLYEEEFGEDHDKSFKLREHLKTDLKWTEEDALEELLKVLWREDNEDQITDGTPMTDHQRVATNQTLQDSLKLAESCTTALGSVLTWLLYEAPLEDWPIFPNIPGLASRCLKALQQHVQKLKRKDKANQEEKKQKENVYFNQFCQAFIKKGTLDGKSHLAEVLSLASASKMEEVSREALNLLEIVLDSQDNPIRTHLSKTFKTTGGHYQHLSDFLLAVYTCIRDSITVSNGRIAVRDEIAKRKESVDATEPLNEIKTPATPGTPEETPTTTDDVHIDLSDTDDDTDGIQLVERHSSSPSLTLPTEGQEKTTPSVEDIDALIPRVTSLKSMLKILALLCDEQTRSLQNYLRKQPGRINSVNIVGSVVELLTHVHRLYENSKLSVPPSEQTMEIIYFCLQALIEFCAGNHKNQEVMVNHQINDELTWIISIKDIDSCQLNSLKAIAVELLETLMEEVAEGSKELIRKLSEDEKLTQGLEKITEDFHFHLYTHTQRQPRHQFLTKFCSSCTDAFRRAMRSTSEQPAPRYAIVPTGGLATLELPTKECKRRVKQSRFRAHNFSRKLKQQREETDPVTMSDTSKTKPPDPPGWKYCKKLSKTIEVFYKSDEKEEPIHTSVSFPYHLEDELHENVKHTINWNLDRSSPEDKLLDFLRYMKPASNVIKHQKWLADGKLRQVIPFISGLRHYALLFLTFILNLIVVATFMVNPDDIPLNGTEIIPLSEMKVISPLTSRQTDVALYVLGAFHFLLSLWMVLEYFAVTRPRLITAGWKAAFPRFILTTIERLKPPDEQKLGESFYGFNSIYRIIFLLSSLLSLIPPLQGYFYCLCLLYIIEESDILQRVLQAVTKNGKSLLWVAFLGVLVLYMYAVLSFAFLHESFFIGDDPPLFCENLGQCFISVVRYGLLDNLGLVLPLVSGEFTEFGWRILYDISFFIIVTTIGLNIVFGIIVDTFSELRDERWKNEQDMKDRCFICSIPNYEFDRQQHNGFNNHVRHDHNMWNYIYYYVYVSRIPPRDRSAIQKYVHYKIEQERIDFFPQKAALKLKHRDADITTEDVVKKVDKASNDLEAEISAQARDARDAVVSQLSKKLAQSEELRHMKDEMEKKFEDELEHMKNEMQQKFEDVHEKFVNVQQTLVREQALFGQEFASIHTAMQTILHRLPAEAPHP